EYRLALVFGAFVGILEKIGGSSTELLQDPTWKCENLTNVENNSDHIKKFLSQ
ncbi:unnamed protein product, partial [marine sediment metagenome]